MRARGVALGTLTEFSGGSCLEDETRSNSDDETWLSLACTGVDVGRVASPEYVVHHPEVIVEGRGHAALFFFAAHTPSDGKCTPSP